METNVPTQRPPITDNPWFWAYVFGTAGLIGVMLLGSKLDRRQEQLDANFTRRQELLEQRAARNQGASVEQIANDETLAPEVEERYVTFQPLYIFIALGTFVGWFILWRQHFQASRSPETTS